MVLCLGPFHHLLEESERLDLLSACAEMTRPMGYVLASFKTKYGKLREVVSEDINHIFKEHAFYRNWISTGRFTVGDGPPVFHTDVRELQRMVSEVPILAADIAACDIAFGGPLRNVFSSAAPDTRAALLNLTLPLARDGSVLGASDKLLVVARKKTRIYQSK